jgi:rifampin ADP-ribosylating transferase
MSQEAAPVVPRYPSPPPYYHGTKVDLKTGDLIGPMGEGPGRIYLVEPTGPWEDDPNLTDKRFPGNPTKSYRSKHPVRVIGEVKEWTGHTLEQLKAMHDGLARLKQQGIEAVDD